MKTIKNQLKRAFTIVELVIVIAVIAALAAVLIPTFVNVLNSASESNDTVLVKNINTILSTEETLHNSTPSTMGEALEWVEDNGYKVENLTPTSSGNILWNQTTNRFLLVDSDGNVVYADSSEESETITPSYIYWYVVNSQSDYTTTNYSLYINCDLSETTVTSNGGIEYAEGIVKNTVVTASTASLSAGEGKSVVSSVKTAAAASTNTSNTSVIVKTNGGTLKLTVSGEATHYGTAETVTLAGSTIYNKNATVTGNIEIASAEVEIVPSSTETDTLSIVLTDAITKSEDAKTIVNMLAENCADVTVVVGSTSSKAAEILADVSSSTVTVVTTTISTDYAGGLGTEASPYQIATAEQFLKISNYSTAMIETPYYFELTDDIDLSKSEISNSYISYYFNGVLEGNGKTITCKTGLSYLFYFVFGETQFNNFKVVWSAYNITRVFFNEAIYANSYDSTNKVYITDTEIVSVSYNNVDFEGVTGTIYDVGENNTALYYYNNNDLVYMVLKNNESYKVDTTDPWYENTVVTGRTQTAKTPTSMVEHVQTMIDCDVNADLTCTGYSAVFSAGQSFNTETIIKKCSYTGTFQGTQPGLLFANYNGYNADSVFSNSAESYTGSWGKVTVEDVSLYGNILSNTSGGSVYFANKTDALSGITYGESRYTLLNKDDTLSLTTSNSQYVITAATTACESYYIQLKLGKVYWYDADYTSSYSENSNMLLTINVSASNIANTGVYKATALSLKQAKDKGIVSSDYTCTNISVEGRSYSFVYYENTWYIIVDLTNSYGSFAEEKQCTAYVYGVADSLPVCQIIEES